MKIEFLTTEAALKLANGNRQVARGLVRAGIVARAEAEARLAGCSLKCKRDDHADGSGGCRNDGSTCICACHDATPYTEQETTK
jgi:hypothetical protein